MLELSDEKAGTVHLPAKKIYRLEKYPVPAKINIPPKIYHLILPAKHDFPPVYSRQPKISHPFYATFINYSTSQFCADILKGKKFSKDVLQSLNLVLQNAKLVFI